MPSIGLGTWMGFKDGKPIVVKEGLVENAVLSALKAGYRHIDTASFYNNENEVGSAIKKSGIKREEIFVTTKLPNYFDSATAGLEDSLKRL